MTKLPHLARILLVDDNAMDVELALDAFHEVRLSNHVEVVTPLQGSRAGDTP